MYIGNDLVQLDCPLNISTFNRKGFSRFLAGEAMHYFEPEHRNIGSALWWAAGEAAYKCLLKQGFEKAFSPAKFKTHIENFETNLATKGTVRYNNRIFYFKAEANTRHLTCVCASSPHALSMTHSLSLHIEPEANITRAITQAFGKLSGIAAEQLVIEKNHKNIPLLRNRLTNTYYNISISNEDRVYLLSILMNKPSE